MYIVVLGGQQSVLCARACVCRCKAAQKLFQLEQRQAKAGSSSGQQEQQQQQANGSQAAAAEDGSSALADAQKRVSQLGEQALMKKLSAMDHNIGKVYSALPVDGAMLVVTGQGDTSDTVWQTELRYKRQQRLEGYKKWTTADEEAYAGLIASAMKGLCFIVVKH
jgi:hypothetical protein